VASPIFTKPYLYKATIAWTGAKRGPTKDYASYSRDYEIEIEGKPTLAGSADKPFRGDPELHNPEDLMLAALATSHMLSYLAKCSRADIHVVSYRDEAVATMSAEGGPMRFTDVLLKPAVTISSGEVFLAKRLHVGAREECFIANSVNFPVRNEATVEREEPI